MNTWIYTVARNDDAPTIARGPFLDEQTCKTAMHQEAHKLLQRPHGDRIEEIIMRCPEKYLVLWIHQSTGDYICLQSMMMRND